MNDTPDLCKLADDIRGAQARITKFVPATPLLRSAALDGLLEGEIFLKAECLQPTGSFKIRGALNAMSVLKSRGESEVIAFSSGNHGIGVAYAGQCLGMRSTIVVPQDAPAAKVAFIASLGGHIVTYKRELEDRESIAASLQRRSGAPLVKPYDDWHTISGQGTCGLEALEQTRAAFDSAIVCTGGGGLVAGIGTILRDRRGSTRLFTAEPEGWDDHKMSFANRERVAARGDPSGFCDGLLAPIPGELTFKINTANGTGGLSTSEDNVKAAMLWGWRHLGLKLEPSGAVALAALLEHRNHFVGQRVLVTLTGGNVDDTLFNAALSSARETAEPNH